MKTYIVRAVTSDGSIVGGVLEDLFGQPLTARTAKSLAANENDRMERRKANGHAAPYRFYADSFETKPLVVPLETIGKTTLSVTVA